VFPGRGEEGKKPEPTLPRPPILKEPGILNEGVFITRRETMSILEEISQAVVAGDKSKVLELTQKAIAEKMDPMTIINQGLVAGMDIVGPRFKNCEMFIPEVLQSAAAMHAGMDLLKPQLKGKALESKGVVVLGTVEGDRHDIGKNLVSMMLEAGGFKVVNLGVDILAEDFVDAAMDNKAQIIGLSALLTTTMPAMKEVIEILREEGKRDKVKVIVGGAPVSQKFCDDIGADGYAPDAASAVDLCRKLLPS
jgi:5-methyltetrahydrofolate--homocysteine methyltransferase